MLRSKTLLLGSCSFEPSALMLRDAAGNALALRSQSLRVLAELSRTPGALVTREALIDAVWGRVAVTDDSVTQCIRDIRAALSDRDRSILKTVVGRGYILNARDALDTVGGLPVVRLERFRATDGIAEEIGETLFEELLVRLTPRRGIRVTADHDLTPTMNSYVVSGRVSVRPDNARVFYRIERHGAAGTLHAATEDAEGDAIWDLPRQVADIIAAQLRTQVLVSAGSDLADADDSGLTAQQLLTKAGWHMTRLQRDSWLSARRSLQRAVLLSPKNPTALSMLAAMETLMIPLIPFDEVAPNVERAMELCDLAVELDPSNDWVLRTRGNARMWLLHDEAGLAHIKLLSQ